MQTIERRQHERRSVALPLKVCVYNDGGQTVVMEARLRDISGGGLSFVCPYQPCCEIGQRLSLSILPAEQVGDGEIELGKATVVWVQQEHGDSMAQVGIMLDDLLSFDHLQQRLPL